MRGMDQKSASAKNSTIILGATARACELRLERHTGTADGTERVEYLCGASGGPEHGFVLGVAGEDLSSMVAICNACPIPAALEGRKSCLNLVPVRRFSGGRRSLPMIQPYEEAAHSSEPVEAYFPCRWFYTLYGQNQPSDTSVCQSCSYWFPRPPRELIPGYWPETQKMLRVVNGEESAAGPPTGFTPAPRERSATSWWQQLFRKIHL